jgi:RimJ/RimL family protein N-acetyltransferase
MLRGVPHPSLETERLLLRPWRADDLDALAAVNAQPEVMRWVAPNRPLRRDESAELLERIVRHWAEHGFGLWAVQPRAGGDACIGFAGLAIPSFLPAVLPAVEVGWRLAAEWWGRGLATEAARASVRFGFEALGLETIVSIIDPANARSLRVAEKLGMRAGPDRLHPVTRRRLRVMEVGRARG